MSCPFYKTMKIENGCRKVQSSGAIVHFCLLPLTADSFSFGAKFQPDVVSLEDWFLHSLNQYLKKSIRGYLEMSERFSAMTTGLIFACFFVWHCHYFSSRGRSFRFFLWARAWTCLPGQGCSAWKGSWVTCIMIHTWHQRAWTHLNAEEKRPYVCRSNGSWGDGSGRISCIPSFYCLFLLSMPFHCLYLWLESLSHSVAEPSKCCHHCRPLGCWFRALRKSTSKWVP